MSVAIRTGSLYESGGAIFVTSAGTKCCVVGTSTIATAFFNDVAAYKNIDTTPALMGAVQLRVDFMGDPSWLIFVHACIDSNDVIHVICSGNDSNDGFQTAYNTLSDPDGTPTWGTWEEPMPYSDTFGGAARGCSISVDSNDKPHVLMQDGVKVHGTGYKQSTYVEKTGASWSTPEVISDITNNSFYGQSITIKASDNAEAFYRNFNIGYPTYATRTSGSWSAGSTYSTAWQRAAVPTGVQVTIGGTVYRYHSTYNTGPFNIYENNVDTGYDAHNSELLGGISARLIGTTRYILYVDASLDVHLISNDGGGWSDEGVLETGTYERVLLSWQYLNDNAPADKIIYLFQNTYGTTIYYGEFDLAAVTRRIFITHV